MKYRLNLFFFLTLAGAWTGLYAQTPDQDPVLFSIGDDHVHISEFIYVYEKSAGADGDYDEKSVREFLELYQQFKLKVKDARAHNLEDNTDLQAELEMYREQLANKYMSDHSVLASLTRELYDRMQWEVDVSHILIRLSEQASEEIEKIALERIEAARKELVAGKDFSEVAVSYSQDRSVSENKGRLGYRRAKLPDGFYDLESTIYNTPVGEVSGPVRSRLGYHLVKVHDKRKTKGNFEIAHILIRNADRGTKDTTLQEIQRIHMMLQEGQDFAALAKKYSEDKNTSEEGGYLGFFNPGTYTPEFEEAAYQLEKDGDFSKPVKTGFGWHIIRRISAKKPGTYEEEQHFLENLIRTDNRYELAKRALTDQIKEQENFHDYNASPAEIAEIVGGDVYRYQWEPPQNPEPIRLFRLRDQDYDLTDFITYLEENRNVRMTRSSSNFDPVSAIKVLLKKYEEDQVLAFEKAHLEEKYPEFREIMREYREGILLFEISREKIWDRAGSDMEGLEKFYTDHKSDYHLPHQLHLDDYKVYSTQPKILKKVKKQIRKKSPEKVLKKFNKAAEVIKFNDLTMEEEIWRKELNVDQSEISEGFVAENSDKKTGITRFSKIRKIDRGAPLKFEEARGAIMSDYQKFLEKQWVDELRQNYEIKVDEKVLQSIVRS